MSSKLLESLYALDVGGYQCDVCNIDLAVAVNVSRLETVLGQGLYALDVSCDHCDICYVDLAVAVSVALNDLVAIVIKCCNCLFGIGQLL